MSRFLFLIFLALSFTAFSQKTNFSIHPILLPPELAYYNNQFSGLYIHEGKLFLMSESRLQDSAEALLYSIDVANLEHKMADSNFVLPYCKYPIYFLDSLRKKMADAGDDYEGLEAIIIEDNVVYLSVETATPSANCYLVKGILANSSVILDTRFLQKMPKPVFKNGDHVYNAGYEATLSFLPERIYSFFEYNYFPRQNYVLPVTTLKIKNKIALLRSPVDPIPFRITDITKSSAGHFTAINYFYRGDGDDSVYRVPLSDPNDTLIRKKGIYQNYVRLVDFQLEHNKFKWKTIWEFPAKYSNYNWEGIATYKNGYFIINDKYTPTRPYSSVLIYLKPD